MPGRVTVLLFATARSAVGASRVSVPIPGEGTSARSLVKTLETSYPQLRPTLAVSRYFLNGQHLTSLARRVRPGDEFAVHPPYSGG